MFMALLISIVWVSDPSTQTIVVATSAVGVFVAMGILRAITQKERLEINASEKKGDSNQFKLVLLTRIVGPVIAAVLCLIFPKLFAPIIVTVMVIVSLLSQFISSRR